MKIAAITPIILHAPVTSGGIADNTHSITHRGDMCQVHQHLCFAHPACRLLEYIPWLRDWMWHPAQVRDGHFDASEAPGVGMEPSTEALAKINLA